MPSRAKPKVETPPDWDVMRRRLEFEIESLDQLKVMLDRQHANVRDAMLKFQIAVANIQHGIDQTPVTEPRQEASVR